MAEPGLVDDKICDLADLFVEDRLSFTAQVTESGLMALAETMAATPDRSYTPSEVLDLVRAQFAS